MLWWLSHLADPLYQMRLHHQIAERLLHLQMAVRQKMNYPTAKHVIVICLVTQNDNSKNNNQKCITKTSRVSSRHLVINDVCEGG